MIIKKDKWLHFIVGIVLGFFGLWLSLIFKAKLFIMIILGLGIPFIIGIIKELIYDKLLKKGTPEIMDVIFTFLGGIIITLVFVIIHFLIK